MKMTQRHNPQRSGFRFLALRDSVTLTGRVRANNNRLHGHDGVSVVMDSLMDFSTIPDLYYPAICFITDSGWSLRESRKERWRLYVPRKIKT